MQQQQWFYGVLSILFLSSLFICSPLHRPLHATTVFRLLHLFSFLRHCRRQKYGNFKFKSQEKLKIQIINNPTHFWRPAPIFVWLISTVFTFAAFASSSTSTTSACSTAACHSLLYLFLPPFLAQQPPLPASSTRTRWSSGRRPPRTARTLWTSSSSRTRPASPSNCSSHWPRSAAARRRPSASTRPPRPRHRRRHRRLGHALPPSCPVGQLFYTFFPLFLLPAVRRGCLTVRLAGWLTGLLLIAWRAIFWPIFDANQTAFLSQLSKCWYDKEKRTQIAPSHCRVAHAQRGCFRD